MHLIEFAEQTAIIAKDQPQYRPLPAHRLKTDPEGRIVCCWKLGWQDRLKVMWTGKIWHQILTFNQPLQPQLLSVDKPAMLIDPDWPAPPTPPATPNAAPAGKHGAISSGRLAA